MLTQSGRNVRQKIVCECLIEAFRKSGARASFQSSREERGQKREEVQATRSSTIPDRGWSGTAHANLGARELGNLLTFKPRHPDMSGLCVA